MAIIECYRNRRLVELQLKKLLPGFVTRPETNSFWEVFGKARLTHFKTSQGYFELDARVRDPMFDKIMATIYFDEKGCFANFGFCKGPATVIFIYGALKQGAELTIILSDKKTHTRFHGNYIGTSWEEWSLVQKHIEKEDKVTAENINTVLAAQTSELAFNKLECGDVLGIDVRGFSAAEQLTKIVMPASVSFKRLA